MTLPTASRLGDIQPFHVMELLRRARELEDAGRDIIHMEVGEPDFGTPQPVLDAAARFLHKGDVHYTASLGLGALREALSKYYLDRFGAQVEPERIVITAGASGALMLALAATTSPGDEWLLPDPGYPSNRHFVRAFEGRAQAIDVDAETDFQPTTAQVAGRWSAQTRGLMVASPANPTGTMLDQDQISGLQAVVQKRGGVLLVDEIYQGLCYGTEASTALSKHQQLFVVNSFSKYFGMTGWRLGWLVVPSDYVRHVEKLAQHFFICPSTPAQHAALAAFSVQTMDILEQRRREFARRRDMLMPALEALGFSIRSKPRGAFYLYADITRVADDSEQLARRLIEEAGVATTPGLDFGDHLPRQHLRFAYTTRIERLQEAIERIRQLVAG